MEILDEGTIKKVRNKTAYVTLVRSAKCDTCKACLVSKRQSVTMPAYSEVDCNAGDRVLVRMPESEITGASFFLYALPIIFLLVGLMIGYFISVTMQIVLSLTFLAVSFLAVWRIDVLFRRKKKYMPTIVGKLEDRKADIVQEDPETAAADNEAIIDKEISKE